jgi:predicted nucleic acid-binding protein
VPVFVDSNVLVYARDIRDADKHERATQWMTSLWRSREGRLSFQVLEEFYATTTRKLTPGLSKPEAQREVRDLVAWRPVVIDRIVLEDAWSIERQFRLAFWDSVIVAAARAAACRYLLTEDLQHRQDLDGLVVVNPFLVRPDELPALVGQEPEGG